MLCILTSYLHSISILFILYTHIFIQTNKNKNKSNAHANADARAHNQKAQPVLLKEERYKFELQVH